MLKAFCIATSLSTAAMLLPLAPKIAQATGCYLVTPDGWRIDLSVLCQKSDVASVSGSTQQNGVPAQIKTIINQTPSTVDYRNQRGLGLDLSAYCQQKYGADTVLVLQENNATGWKCLADNQAQDISFVEACSSQYGSSAIAAMGDLHDINSWHCRLTTNVSHQTSGS